VAGETLKTAAQLLADFPDNTAGLIEAVNSRNLVVSAGNDVAFVEESFGVPGVALPMTQNMVDTVVTNLWSSPTEAFRFWQRSGGGFTPDYGAIVTPAGVVRISAFTYEVVAIRQPPVLPLNYGGIYQLQWSDGAPGIGDIDFHSNLTQFQIHNLPEGGGDLSPNFATMGANDIFNVGGILYKLNAPGVDGGAFWTFTYDDPLARPDPEGAGDPHSFVQGLARDDDLYTFALFKNGVQEGSTQLRSIGDTGDYFQIKETLLNEPAASDVFDLRVAKVEAASPDIDVALLGGSVFGVLV